MITRKLWNDTEIPALGLGCWAIGGTWTAGGSPSGWGQVDDAESIRAIHRAVERGVRFFDTAQAYGIGHSESVLGDALRNSRDVLIGTKVGITINAAQKTVIGGDWHKPAIMQGLDASLKRLRREKIDLVHLHLNSLAISDAAEVFDTLDGLVVAGKIGAYGWSTDYPDRAEAFAMRQNFVSVQHAMNVFFKASALLPVIEKHKLLSVNRSPLAMGLLTGKFNAQSHIGADDVRGQSREWMDYFKDGKPSSAHLAQLDTVRELLQSGGRSLVQGAIGWLWGRSSQTLPIPSFRTLAQVDDLTGALEKGALPPPVMDEIERIIIREPEGPPRDR